MICDRVAIITEGRIVDQGKLQDMISEKILFTEIILSGLKEEEIKDFGADITTQAERTFVKVFDEDNLEKILQCIQEKKGKIHSLIPRAETLEDLFVGMVKKE
jgi:ABC-2 type transport system ATP-binding protein